MCMLYSTHRTCNLFSGDETIYFFRKVLTGGRTDADAMECVYPQWLLLLDRGSPVGLPVQFTNRKDLYP